MRRKRGVIVPHRHARLARTVPPVVPAAPGELEYLHRHRAVLLVLVVVRRRNPVGRRGLAGQNRHRLEAIVAAVHEVRMRTARRVRHRKAHGHVRRRRRNRPHREDRIAALRHRRTARDPHAVRAGRRGVRDGHGHGAGGAERDARGQSAHVYLYGECFVDFFPVVSHDPNVQRRACPTRRNGDRIRAAREVGMLGRAKGGVCELNDRRLAAGGGQLDRQPHRALALVHRRDVRPETYRRVVVLDGHGGRGRAADDDPARHRGDGDGEGLVTLDDRVLGGLDGERVRAGIGRDGDAGRAAAVVRAVRRPVRARNADRRGGGLRPDDVQRDADRAALRHAVARSAQAHRRVVVVADGDTVSG